MDWPSFLLGMVCGIPLYLVLDRLVFPFAEWIAAGHHGGE